MNYQDLPQDARCRIQAAAIKAIAEAITMENPVWTSIYSEELPFGWFVRQEDDQHTLCCAAPGGSTEHGLFPSWEAAQLSAWEQDIASSLRTISIPEFSWNEGSNQ